MFEDECAVGFLNLAYAWIPWGSIHNQSVKVSTAVDSRTFSISLSTIARGHFSGLGQLAPQGFMPFVVFDT